ncbi:hypothetical protein PHYBLDRAFT_145131 [Phycomyces blakesleeanus NRRL 1555(-)]|uniref:Uncharacterized protein n=1 Tax=Phycomyces blakesleeanus (strain ATCC 8743b / DSM 1359 / FGSC 10004 / NBRC 33097 / NRRL 1555) TaxID=763407 RepID=A0A162PT52_PHYB8|nr:hypothetical protein PHYBLDRAFT_145131 [Phycomyces blakesleeanus NRRL 1555(-)]OAD73656.1 hypothetical protein PHYBLDRAFT_145131 [Phycomyces blakesleeanus NRRL 1555(-)]|eukprot:XP_018291696.1 hypothetical protein PHYBLDRAFT_145131 [Phycomyces blakesleeanus NRRL 1555(-)]
MSTSLKCCPSLHSIASDLAIQSGAPLDDVVAMGNWSSSSVFDTHYRRSRAIRTNITESQHFSDPVRGPMDSVVYIPQLSEEQTPQPNTRSFLLMNLAS